jgi:hypothetical protein
MLRLHACTPFAIIVLALGCSSKDPNRLETVPVTGTVTYNGKPVDGAIVTFLARKENIPATGMTDAEGRFSLTTYEDGDGAVIGDHDVSVNKTIGSASTAVSIDEDPEHYTPGITPPPVVKHLVPERYSQPDTSGLKVTVAKGVKNDVELALTN